MTTPPTPSTTLPLRAFGRLPASDRRPRPRPQPFSPTRIGPAHFGPRHLALALLLLAISAATANAQGTTTQHSTFQAVNAQGQGIYGGGFPITMRGIVLNNPEDMLDSTFDTPGFLGAQWQVFVQTDIDGDFGGTAVWMGQKYGNIRGDAGYNYSQPDWEAEMDRVNYPQGMANPPLRAGDVVEVSTPGGLFFNGKYNINETHDNDPAADFTITRLGSGSLPTPASITLADVKDSTDTFIFQEDRLSGAEHYQGTLVELSQVSLAGPWGGANDTVTVTDGNGRTFPVRFGLNPDFDLTIAPSGQFSVVGIFDQEDPNDGSNTFTDNYRLWVMDPGQFAQVPEPGSLLLLGVAVCLGLARRRRPQ